jgi:hypothetical protein
MSLHRAGLLAITTLFTAGLTSAASAGCCDWGAAAPLSYAPPVAYGASVGCGGCGSAVYAAPVAYAMPTSFAYRTGCGGCGRSVTLVAPSPIYVVNQGPHYSGPGIMTYKTYSTGEHAGAYPYVHGAGMSYTGYDGGPYANPADYRPSVYRGPAIGVAPSARIIHRYTRPRALRVRADRHMIAPRAVAARIYRHAAVAPRALDVRMPRHIVAPRALDVRIPRHTAAPRGIDVRTPRPAVTPRAHDRKGKVRG